MEALLDAPGDRRAAAPVLLRLAARNWLATPDRAAEVFCPSGLIVVARNDAEMTQRAAQLKGQLTASLHIENSDTALAQSLLPVLERKAGRGLAKGFPTGAEVCEAIVHGRFYPASTHAGAKSVAALSIRRFLRLACYQNMPDALPPADLN